MSSTAENNKRIAKNTAMLYIRTLFVMLIAIYTSRVILDALGVEDYGIYQVIGGLVAMFAVMSNALSAAISRFITFELGRGDIEKLKRIFSTSLIIQIGISVIVLLVAEIIAVWFIETQMQIPPGRMDAAKWVLQCTLITFCINLISIPYNACIIAHEHMKAFAYISIIDALLKLGVCFCIYISPIDKLVFYAVLLMLSAILVRLIYSIYCHRYFVESRSGFVFDRAIFKDMLSFSGWSFFTNTNGILNTQGVNMLINVYFGVTLNAARGIATQVEGAVLQFVNSFTMAINPQIVKSYAAGEKESLYMLVCRGAKFSYFAMLLMALPIICEARKILEIWLTVVPDYTVIFVQLSLILGIFDCIGSSGYTACAATGKIRLYALVLTPIGLLEFPLTWVFFFYGASVVSTYYLYIFVKSLVVVARMYLLRDMIGLKPRLFVANVFRPIILTTFVAIIPSILIIYFMPPSLVRLFLSILIGALSVMMSSLFMGMDNDERNVVFTRVGRLFEKMKS